MIIITLKQLSLKLSLVALLILPELASAQFFNYNSIGDVLGGFRKTGVNAGKYEFVVDFGNVTNFLAQSAGSTVTISTFSPAQLTDAFTDTGGFQYLQWSAFSALYGVSSIGSWKTPLGAFPADTLWYTIPAANITTQTAAPARNNSGTSASAQNEIAGAGQGANTILVLLTVIIIHCWYANQCPATNFTRLPVLLGKMAMSPTVILARTMMGCPMTLRISLPIPLTPPSGMIFTKWFRFTERILSPARRMEWPISWAIFSSTRMEPRPSPGQRR
jgi:hypothetical protein